MFPVLWSFRRCPFAMRARLAIQKSGQRVEIREVFLREKPESFLSLSSDGTVPILELTCGRVINESLDIMFWALRKRDPSGWLNIFHKKPDFVGNFFNELDRSFKDNLDRYKYSSRFNEGTKLYHRANGALFLFHAHPPKYGPVWLCGE